MAKKTTKRTTKGESDSEPTFEASLAELEQIVGDLEGGELGLAESLKRYEQGVSHLRRCQTQLNQAERRIELLSGIDAEGNPITEPFDAGHEESLETKAKTRTRKRSAPKKGSSQGVDDERPLF